MSNQRAPLKQLQQFKPERSTFGSDLIAGLTFAVVNVPQAMAHALLAFVSNPVMGIYTLMVAVPVGAVFTSSVFMNVSTTSALSVATGEVLGSMTEGSRTQALIALVFLIGVIQLLAGVFRLGFLVRFVSNAVMTGFLNGIAVLIILGQLGDLTGYDSIFSNRIAQALDLLLRLNQVDRPTTVIGLLTLGLILLLTKTQLRKFAFIIAIAVSTTLLALLGWQSVETVGDIATITAQLPDIQLPTVSLLAQMLLPAFSIAIIGLIQGAGVSQGYPNPDGKYPNISRDFFGQGMANIATSFVGGIPAGGSISGTALIMSAGARSRLTNISVGLFVALIVVLFAPLVSLVPMSALAALLIVAGFQGMRIPQAWTVWNTSRVSGVVMIMTFLATLIIPLQFAVLVGVAFSILLYVARQSNKVILMQIVPIPGGLPEEHPAPRTLPSNQVTMLQIYGSLFFAAAKSLEEMLPAPDGTNRAAVLIGLRGRDEIGSTFVTVLERYAKDLHAHDSKLMLVGVSPDVYSQLVRSGLRAIIGDENIFPATAQLGEAMNRALAIANQWLDQPEQIAADADTLYR
ncbi:MAG: SulP family inorganic anion transporter [Caldilineales bacterium]